jgi:hypothetical protein
MVGRASARSFFFLFKPIAAGKGIAGLFWKSIAIAFFFELAIGSGRKKVIGNDRKNEEQRTDYVLDRLTKDKHAGLIGVDWICRKLNEQADSN